VHSLRHLFEPSKDKKLSTKEFIAQVEKALTEELRKNEDL